MARCWGFQIVSEAILRVFRSEGGSGAGPGPTFRAVAAVGGRCGPQARLVEDEGEEGNFTRGMGGLMDYGETGRCWEPSVLAVELWILAVI